MDNGLAATGISLAMDADCGMLCDLAITEGNQVLRPMHMVPWLGEDLPHGTPPHLRRMQGDFFCAPFGNGGGAAPIAHGWPANGHWVTAPRTDRAVLTAQLAEPVQGATVTKHLRVVPGHPFLYQAHVFTGGQGTISAANHAMVALPNGGLISVSPKRDFRTPDTPLESDPTRGRSALVYPATATDPTQFPAANGGTLDLMRYPFLTGHEDFVVATEAEGTPLGWTAVVRLGFGQVYLSLRNPVQLPTTMLWQSDGGRDYVPWSGRHRACLGVEEGFAPNMLGQAGGFALGGTVDIRHVIGAIAWPTEARVTAVTATTDSLTVQGADGSQKTVPFDLAHLMQ